MLWLVVIVFIIHILLLLQPQAGVQPQAVSSIIADELSWLEEKELGVGRHCLLLVVGASLIDVRRQ